MADIRLPLVGHISKKALAIGGTASVLLIGFIWIRHRNQPAAPAASSDANANPADGSSDYTDPGLQDTTMGPTYGSGGYYDPNTGQWIYGNTGTGQAAATSNPQWAQMAESYLTGTVGADPSAVSEALGAYLAGKAVTSAEESLIDQAIAYEGYPPASGPNGYPPGIRSQGTTGQTSGGGGKPVRVTPVNLHTTQVSKASAQVAWIAPRIPSGQGPLTGYTVAAYDSKGHLANGPFTVPAGQLYANLGGLKTKTSYHVHVWCDPAATGGPHATVSFTTK